MNTVPIDFCQRVLATRKCCDDRFGYCFCYETRSPPKVADRKWNQPQTKKIYFSFQISPVNGKWKYGFSNVHGSGESLTMEELKNIPQLKNLRITAVEVWESRLSLKHDVVDLEKLLNFVSFIANEPWLILRNVGDHVCSSPQWETVIKWLSQRWFSYVSVGTLSASNYPILETQLLRRKPCEIRVNDFEQYAEVLERRLMSGDLRILCFPEVFGSSYSYGKHPFSKAVFGRIIRNFLEAPQNYAKDKLDITAEFEESADSEMEAAVQMKLCSVTKPWQGSFIRTRDKFQYEYVPNLLCRYSFDKAPTLLVDKLSSGRWHLHSR